MEEIDINNIDINDDLELIDNLYAVDKKIEYAIFDTGLDKYLLNKNKIHGGQIKYLIEDYKIIYRNKKFITGDIITRAYDYVINMLKNSYVYKNGLLVTDGNIMDAMSIISRLYELYDNKDEFKHLNNFMKYYNQKELKLVK